MSVSPSVAFVAGSGVCVGYFLYRKLTADEAEESVAYPLHFKAGKEKQLHL